MKIEDIPFRPSPLEEGWTFTELLKLAGKSNNFSKEADEAIKLYEKKYKRKIAAYDLQDLKATKKELESQQFD